MEQIIRILARSVERGQHYVGGHILCYATNMLPLLSKFTYFMPLRAGEGSNYMDHRWIIHKTTIGGRFKATLQGVISKLSFPVPVDFFLCSV